MNNRNFIITFLLLVGISFAGCKKNKELEFDRNNVYLQTFPMDEIYTDGNGYFHCTLHGLIQSPYMLDLKEYGFYINNGSSNPDKIIVGSGKKLGLVSGNYTSINPISDASVVLYVVFQNGEELKSSDIVYNPSGQILPNPIINAFYVDPNITAGTAYLSSDFTYDMKSSYSVADYSIFINESGSLNQPANYSLLGYVSPPIYSIGSIDLSSTGFIFIKGTSYDFVLQIVLTPPISSSNQTPIIVTQSTSVIIN